jgi:hypothetical protein
MPSLRLNTAPRAEQSMDTASEWQTVSKSKVKAKPQQAAPQVRTVLALGPGFFPAPPLVSAAHESCPYPLSIRDHCSCNAAASAVARCTLASHLAPSGPSSSEVSIASILACVWLTPAASAGCSGLFVSFKRRSSAGTGARVPAWASQAHSSTAANCQRRGAGV